MKRRAGPARGMTPAECLRFVRRHGVVLEAARGPVPSLAEAFLGVGQSGRWWSHARARAFYGVTRAVRAHPSVLVCRLVSGKITYVHRRLWPALYVLRRRVGERRLAAITEVHTPSGKHVMRSVPFARFLPGTAIAAARRMTKARAKALLADYPEIV